MCVEHSTATIKESIQTYLVAMRNNLISIMKKYVFSQIIFLIICNMNMFLVIQTNCTRLPYTYGSSVQHTNLGRGRWRGEGRLKMEQVDKASIHGHREGMKNILHQEKHGHQ